MAGSAKTHHRSTAAPIIPIKAVAAHELVADQLRKAIYLGRFVPGQKLPAERDLASQLGVSRTTAREAVRTVVSEGLVETRRGATGGNFVRSWFKVRDVTPEVVARHAGEITEVFEFRIPVECAATRLAALRRSDRDLDELRALSHHMDELTASAEIRQKAENITEFFADDNAFHLLIAQAGGNKHLANAVEQARTQMFLPIGAVFQQLEERANAFHADIVAAIGVQDPDAAENAMRLHITETYDHLRTILARADKIVSGFKE